MVAQKLITKLLIITIIIEGRKKDKYRKISLVQRTNTKTNKAGCTRLFIYLFNSPDVVSFFFFFFLFDSLSRQITLPFRYGKEPLPQCVMLLATYLSQKNFFFRKKRKSKTFFSFYFYFILFLSCFICSFTFSSFTRCFVRKIRFHA